MWSYLNLRSFLSFVRIWYVMTLFIPWSKNSYWLITIVTAISSEGWCNTIVNGDPQLATSWKYVCMYANAVISTYGIIMAKPETEGRYIPVKSKWSHVSISIIILQLFRCDHHSIAYDIITDGLFFVWKITAEHKLKCNCVHILAYWRREEQSKK